jgi:endoglucanase
VRRCLFCSYIAALFIASATALGAATSFPLHTAGPYIMDSNGHRVRINAVNWYGAESTDYVVGGLQENTLANIVQQIKDAGFNAVRLPWSNQMYESNPVVGNYALRANPALIGEHALSIFDQVVNALASAGLMVILDNHNSDAEWCCGNDGNELWYNSSYPETSWLRDWQAIVRRYASQHNVIGVDLRNEPRHTATWGGSSSTDWHAAAQRGGNAVLNVNSNLLIFVEGIAFASNLSGASTLPIKLNIPNRVVYSAHDYAFENSGLTGYNDWVNRIARRWGYLVTGNDPQPFWLGEFGTCNTSDSCVNSTSNSQNGFWFHIITTYLARYSVDWAYWPLNGTQSSGRSYGTVETYGILNRAWNGIALPALSNALHQLASSSGGPANGTYRIVNANSGLAMEVSGASLSSGASVDQWSYAGAVNQQWTITNIGSGTYMVVNRDSGLSLDITGQSISAGGSVEQWKYWGGGNQQFVITATHDGKWRIVNARSGLVVEVPSASTANGTDLDQWFANGATSQQWAFLAP